MVPMAGRVSCTLDRSLEPVNMQKGHLEGNYIRGLEVRDYAGLSGWTQSSQEFLNWITSPGCSQREM